ncbi:MAG: cytochrome P460 family protein [Methyloligellaceae bacterium]
MKNYRKVLGAGVVLGVAAVLAVGFSMGEAIGAGHKKMKPCCDDASIKYSKSLWSAMTTANLVGKSAINSRPYEGQAPHGAVLQTLDSSVTVGKHAGRVIVKKNFGPKGITLKDVWTDPNKHLKAVTVMFKREKGYDKDNADWFWAKYKPDGSLDKNPKGMQLAGRVMKGADKGCIACHSGADGKDYLFINDK